MRTGTAPRDWAVQPVVCGIDIGVTLFALLVYQGLNDSDITTSFFHWHVGIYGFLAFDGFIATDVLAGNIAKLKPYGGAINSILSWGHVAAVAVTCVAFAAFDAVHGSGKFAKESLLNVACRCVAAVAMGYAMTFVCIAGITVLMVQLGLWRDVMFPAYYNLTVFASAYYIPPRHTAIVFVLVIAAVLGLTISSWLVWRWSIVTRRMMVIAMILACFGGMFMAAQWPGWRGLGGTGQHPYALSQFPFADRTVRVAAWSGLYWVGSYLAIMGLRFRRALYRQAALEGGRYCQGCQYDLIGTLMADRRECPECGRPIPVDVTLASISSAASSQ